MFYTVLHVSKTDIFQWMKMVFYLQCIHEIWKCERN
jgi:hypothetical protein